MTTPVLDWSRMPSAHAARMHGMRGPSRPLAIFRRPLPAGPRICGARRQGLRVSCVSWASGLHAALQYVMLHCSMEDTRIRVKHEPAACRIGDVHGSPSRQGDGPGPNERLGRSPHEPLIRQQNIVPPASFRRAPDRRSAPARGWRLYIADQDSRPVQSGRRAPDILAIWSVAPEWIFVCPRVPVRSPFYSPASLPLRRKTPRRPRPSPRPASCRPPAPRPCPCCPTCR